MNKRRWSAEGLLGADLPIDFAYAKTSFSHDACGLSILNVDTMMRDYSIKAANNKETDQTAPMHRLICIFEYTYMQMTCFLIMYLHVYMVYTI